MWIRNFAVKGKWDYVVGRSRWKTVQHVYMLVGMIWWSRGRCDDGGERKRAAGMPMSTEEAVGWMHKYRLRKEHCWLTRHKEGDTMVEHEPAIL